MKNEDYLGILLKHDHFLNLMSDEPTEDIEAIWRDMVGIHDQPAPSKKDANAKIQGILKNAAINHSSNSIGK